MVEVVSLKGMKAICSFANLSEATLLSYKRQYPGMPMNKVGGLWFGAPDRLEAFFRDLATGDTGKWLADERQIEPGNGSKKGNGKKSVKRKIQ